MGKNKINIPSSGGGLVRYFDDFRSKVEFRPGLIIVLVLVVDRKSVV